MQIVILLYTFSINQLNVIIATSIIPKRWRKFYMVDITCDKKEEYMELAVKLARKSYKNNEAPIGCVIVRDDGVIVGKGYNKRNKKGTVLGHAEIMAIKKACKACGDWRLEDCTMYVTLEPCQMCAGAIVQSRMKKVVIGAMSPKSGCAGSVINLLQMSEFNHQVEIEKGILEEKCASLMSEFFKELRNSKDK